MNWRLSVLVLWAVGVGAGPAAGQRAAAGNGEAVAVAGVDSGGHSADPAAILRLIDQLSSIDYAEREAADARLRQMGLSIVGYLSQRYGETDDFETRVRIQQIAERVFFWDRVLGRNGFLGIQHRPYNSRTDARVEPGTSAFVIARVIPDTSAERAGLRDGDLIISIDGNKLPASADANDFAEQIRHKPPGTVITLELYRGNEYHKIAVAIGHRPRRYYGGSATPKLNAQYAAAVEEFPEWWAAHFGREPATHAQEYLPLDREGAGDGFARPGRDDR